jgi:radical SAM superfamily enzyme YgiQ (UPF0313 family)
MPAIVLATINAKYSHASFGLRYLRANLKELREESIILEFAPLSRATDLAEEILAHQPTIIGLGVYIWNARATLDLVHVLRRVAPEVKIILGGPEVSYESEAQELCQLAHYVVSGEGESTFHALCQGILSGRPSLQKFQLGQAPDLDHIVLPYDEYTDLDISQRVVYVEASRGCPFRCEFCLSSLDKSVRAIPLPRLLAELDRLLARGLRHFKFVDRTFNLKVETSLAILEFFLQRQIDGVFLHFEMIPDRLPVELRSTIERFPEGTLQFEVGVQSFNPQVNDRISRRQDLVRMSDNFAFLRDHTAVHVHADLIIGLPGETLESFGAGLDRLHAMRPQEIQVGILKRLRGAPIARHEREFKLVFDPNPPYEVLSTREIPFVQMQEAKRMALFWDRLVNQGHFNETITRYLFADASPFDRIMGLSRAVFASQRRVHSLTLETIGREVEAFLRALGVGDATEVRETISRDLRRAGQRSLDHIKERPTAAKRPAKGPPPRQRRHLHGLENNEAPHVEVSE